MAGRIAGITIEIGGDTTKLQTALKGVDKTLKTTQSNLRDINKLLKLDPKNTELLSQKQRNLQTAISTTKQRLAELKNAQSQVQKGSAEWDALQREIIATEQDLDRLEGEYHSFGSVAKQVVMQAGKEISVFGQKVTELGNKFKPVSAAAAGLLTAMIGLGMNAVTGADDLNTLAKQTGLTTEEIQKLQYAADLIDVSFDDIVGALRKMKPKMTETNETFQRLGVSVTDADGNLRNANDVFFEAVEALSHIENETERDQVAMDLFGKSADELAGIIDDGGKGLQKYGDEAERLGIILDQDTLDSMNAMNDSIDRMKMTFKGSAMKLGAKIAEAAAPVVEKLAAAVEKLAEWIGQLTPEQMQLVMAIAAVVAVVAPLLIIIGQVITGIGAIVSAFSFLLSPIGLVIAAIVALVAIGVLLYKNWDTIKAKAAEVWAAAVEKFNAMKAAVVAAVNNMKASVTATWEAIKTTVTTVIDTVKTTVTNTWNNITTAVSTAVDNMKTKIQTTFNTIKSIVSNAVTRLKSLLKFSWSLPKLKVPHFNISGGVPPYGLGGKGTAPSISIDWYKRAYDNPVLFTSPTVLATQAGLKGFGDGAGAEIVMGLDRLRELVGSQDRNVTVNVVLHGDARSLFRVMSKTNNTRTKATGYNAFAMGV